MDSRNFLALDIGTRRTGVAFCDPRIGIAHPRDTIRHTSEEELIAAIHVIVDREGISQIVVGLPLLPSGEEGAQAKLVRAIADRLSAEGIASTLLDERYTTPRSGDADGDAAAACALLDTWISRRGNV